MTFLAGKQENMGSMETWITLHHSHEFESLRMCMVMHKKEREDLGNTEHAILSAISQLELLFS